MPLSTRVELSRYSKLPESRYKLFLLGLLLLNLYCVLFLYSRAAYIATAIGMLILFSFRNKKLLAPLIAAIILWQFVLPQKAIQRIQETTNIYGELDESSSRRLAVWRESVNIFQRSPITGVGFGVFRTLGFDLQDTHNIYIKMMVEQGIIGLFIFLLLVSTFFYEGWRLYHRGDDELSRALGFGLVVCIPVLLVNNLFGDRWTYLELSAYLWIFAGLVSRLNIISEPIYKEKLKELYQRQEKGPLRDQVSKTNSGTQTFKVDKIRKKFA